MPWKIGEVTKRTGLTERALRYYEEQNLIGPIDRSLSGHRLYSQTDLLRLQQICYMRYLGIPLTSMKKMLKDNKQLVPQLKQQLVQLRSQRKDIKSLEDKISTLVECLNSKYVSSNDLDDILFKTMENMMMYEKYFKQSEIEKIHKTEHNNDDLITEEAWNQWVESMKNQMLSGANPQSQKVQELMNHWNKMIVHITGHDEKRLQAFNDLMHNEPQARLDHGIDDALFLFMSKASGGH